MPSTSTNATEFVKFINELGDDYYFEDSSDDLWALLWVFDNDKKEWVVKPGKADHEFVIENDFGGSIAWQGKGEDPHQGWRDVDVVFREWRKTQTSKTIVVVVPNAKVDEVVEALKAFGLTPTF